MSNFQNQKTIIIIIFLVIGLFLVIETKKLKLLLVIHRHGDRTPVFTFPTDPYINESVHWPDHYQRLTAKGKQRMYDLGKYIRKRYKDFLGDIPHEVYTRSSAKDRCMTSAALVLAGLYPPVGRWKWNDNLGKHWQPIPVQTVDFPLDGMINPDSICPKAEVELKRIFYSEPVQRFMKKHEKTLQFISNKTKININHYTIARDLFNTFEIQKSHNYKHPVWVDSKVYECLHEFHEMHFIFESSSQLIRRLRAGLLLKDIANRMKQSVSDPDLKYKIFIYSTHDTQVAYFLNALNIYNNRSPPFGAAVFVELYELNKFRNKPIEYKVEVHYLNVTESEKTFELVLKDCLKNGTKVCVLDQFLHLIEPLIPTDWETECKANDFDFIPKYFQTNAFKVIIIFIIAFIINFLISRLFR